MSNMHTLLSTALRTLIVFLLPVTSFAQAPVLGTAAKFVLFTTNGAMTCSGTTYLNHLTGDVGSNLAGSVTGFGNVDGVMHVFDTATGNAAADVVSLYTQLSTAIPTATLASPFGGGVILAPGVYSIPTAATLTGDLILDAAGDPAAVFIFQIGGVLSTDALSKVKLVNGAMACNVFWQAGGAVNVGTRSFLRGTIVANGQIDLTSTLDTLEGRAFAINAPVLVSQLVAYTPLGCGSPYLTGPAAPALASTAAYGVFSSIGAVTSTPVTYVTGDVGANTTVPSGFVPGNVTGTIRAMNTLTAAAAGDLTNVYNYLVAMPADIHLLDPANLGYNLVLTPHSYQITGITQLTGSLILNAQGNPNAIFVIKINGSFTTGTLSKIVLTNGTQAKNVYWKIDGAVNVFSNSVFNGTLVVAGAITLNTGDTLNGRAMTINGAVAINGSYINITPLACVAAPITGNTTVCEGSTTTLSDADLGGTWESSDTTVATIDSTSGVVTGIAAGTSVIKYTTALACEATTTVTVNPSPGIITGANRVCTGSATTLSDATTGGTWSSSNPLVASVGSTNGIVTGITPGNAIITYSTGAICVATKSMTVDAIPTTGIITGASTVCQGSTTTLSNAIGGGVWTSANTAIASVGSVSGIVTGVAAGTTDITYTITNSCGTAFTTKTMTVGALANAGTITGASVVCQGSTTTLSNATSGGVWTSANPAIATVGTASGVVTGVTTGTTDISYTTTNSCGTASATKSMTVGTLPNAGTITGSPTVCEGSTTTLSNATSGGEWTSANTAIATIGSASGIVTGVAAGMDTISYSVTNSCGTVSATKGITVNPLPNAGTITGPSGVCIGSTITLSNAVTGGVWSSSNTRASVTGGVVTGITSGIDTIMYRVTNVCGTATATKIITVNQLPAIPVISIQSPSTVCSGTMYMNFGTATLPFSGTYYTWTATNATVWAQGTAHQNALINFDNTGTAYVSLHQTMTGTGCTSKATVTVNVSTSIADQPTVTYFNNHFVCTPNTADSYQWGYDDIHSLDSTILTGEINQDYLNMSPDFANKAYWAMTVSGGCLQKTYYRVPTSVQNVTTDAIAVTVYPNPANTFINVAIASSQNGNIQIDLINSIGQKMSSVQTADNKVTIDVATLPAGMYLISCYKDGIKIAATRFVKN